MFDEALGSSMVNCVKCCQKLCQRDPVKPDQKAHPLITKTGYHSLCVGKLFLLNDNTSDKMTGTLCQDNCQDTLHSSSYQ